MEDKRLMTRAARRASPSGQSSMDPVKNKTLFDFLRSEFDRGCQIGWEKGFDIKEWDLDKVRPYRSAGANLIEHFYTAAWKGRADPAGYVAFRLGYLVGSAQHAANTYESRRDQWEWLGPMARAAQEALLTALTFLVGSPAGARHVYDGILRNKSDWREY